MGDSPSTPGAASASLVVREAGGITAGNDVDDALAGELADAFARWGRIQTYGLVAIAGAVVGTGVVAPGIALVVALLCLLPAVLVANVLVDRATVDEFVSVGLSGPLAKRLLRKTYLVPAAYALLPAAFSKKPAAKRAVVDVIRAALKKC